MMKLIVLMLTGLLFYPLILFAGEADVLKVKVQRSGSSYTFNVTVAHNDEGWQHYADKWDIVDPDGQVVATRVLYHPHVNEQPFTRSLSGVAIDAGITSVIVRAHDLVHGYGGKKMMVDLPK
ncbi:MAG: hypothetical protein QM483_00595 [Desulfuromusa sp.]